MLFECDLLSQYNQATEQWRYQDAEERKCQQAEEALEICDGDIEVDHLFIGWADLNVSPGPRDVKKYMMPVELEEESGLKLFSEVELERTTIQVVAPLPLPCFVGSLGSKQTEIASKFDQQ